MRSESERIRRRLTLRILPILVVALSVAAISAVTPLAYASPPDPSWVKGIYDDADFDDVVGFITSGAGVVEPFLQADLRPVPPLVGDAPQPEPESVSSLLGSSLQPRAPPAA
jgi:hypothetical protein